MQVAKFRRLELDLHAGFDRNDQVDVRDRVPAVDVRRRCLGRKRDRVVVEDVAENFV
jgi:hypothetical protein